MTFFPPEHYKPSSVKETYPISLPHLWFALNLIKNLRDSRNSESVLSDYHILYGSQFYIQGSYTQNLQRSVALPCASIQLCVKAN